MKKYFGITSSLLMLAGGFNSHAALTGKPDRNAPAVVNQGRSAETGEAVFQGQDLTTAEVQGIKCERGNSVTYQFIQSISTGVDIKRVGNQVQVKIPEYYSACIEDINIKSKVGPDNNVYISFEVIPDSRLTWNMDNFEKTYQNCVQANYGNVQSWDQADQQNLIKRNKFQKAVILSGVDANRDSEVIIASPNKVDAGTDNYSSASFGNSFSSLPTSSDPKWNCMRFEDPAEKPIMVNKTEAFRLREEAIALCKNDKASLSDIDAMLEQMRKSDTGNYQDIIKILGNVKNQLMKEEIEKSVTRLEAIENKFVSDDDDDIGVGKEEAKKLASEYSGIMKKFNDEILPSIQQEIETLLVKRDEAEDPEKIDEKIKELNDLTAQFVRNESDNTDAFAALKNGLKKYNLKKAAREIFKAATSAKYFARVYEEDEDERGPRLSLSEAAGRAKNANKSVVKEMFTRWDDEKAIASGSRAPIERKKKVIAEIRKKGQTNFKNFVMKQQEKQKYFGEYLQRMNSYYCGSGADMKKCMYMRSQYMPKLQNMYLKSAQKEQYSWRKMYDMKYGKALESQNSLINRYENMYNQAQYNLMQEKMSSNRRTMGSGVSDSEFGFWLDTDMGSEFGIDPMFDGMDFGLQNRMPAGAPGSGMFSNPYMAFPQQ